MVALRWILLTITALVAVGFATLLALADNFRRSFGASENGPLVALVPLATMAVLLASLLFPGQRALLHLGAAAALGLVAYGVWVLRESSFVGLVALLYSGLFLLWYWSAAGLRAAAPAP